MPRPETLGRDGDAYRKLVAPLVEHWDELSEAIFAPIFRPPKHPLVLGGFGLKALRSVEGLARSRFRDETARALLAGLSAHANLPLSKPFTASFGLVLAAAGHAAGWPVARGGSQAIADALAAYLRSLGGEVVTGRRIASLAELPNASATLLDLTPRQVVALAGDRLPDGYRRRLLRWRYGHGVFKADFALDGPIPWRSPDCARAATLHLGGSLAEIAASEQAVADGRPPERPYVIVSQPSLIDPSRAPAGKHTAWAYCHVPSGCDIDMTGRIEVQIERFAPGFRDIILAKQGLGPAQLERYNENYIGGDIQGGSLEGLQLFLRPAPGLNPYETPVAGLYICSSSTPPGGGVHGMCGYHAACAVLRRQGG
jgi:phytoene dehydrogenase-like protein